MVQRIGRSVQVKVGGHWKRSVCRRTLGEDWKKAVEVQMENHDGFCIRGLFSHAARDP